MPPNDARHEMPQLVFRDDFWDVMMFAFHMLNQNAREPVFPQTLSCKAGAMAMFAVRSLFSTPGRLQQDISALVAEGKVPARLADESQPLDFLFPEGGAKNIIERPTAMPGTRRVRTSYYSARAIPRTWNPTSKPFWPRHRHRKTCRKSMNGLAALKVLAWMHPS